MIKSTSIFWIIHTFYYSCDCSPMERWSKIRRMNKKRKAFYPTNAIMVCFESKKGGKWNYFVHETSVPLEIDEEYFKCYKDLERRIIIDSENNSSIYYFMLLIMNCRQCFCDLIACDILKITFRYVTIYCFLSTYLHYL